MRQKDEMLHRSVESGIRAYERLHGSCQEEIAELTRQRDILAKAMRSAIEALQDPALTDGGRLGCCMHDLVVGLREAGLEEA